MKIGKTIRRLRLQNGLTQEELANRADLTKGFISQVENDGTSPSIATLEDIVSALGVTLGDFFKMDADPAKVVYQSGDWVVSGDSGDGFELTFLVPKAHQNAMEPVLVTLEPGEAALPHEGHEGEEFGFVLAGTIEIRLGSTAHKARKGDCFYYQADGDHRMVNAGKRRARILMVSCPPSF